MGDFYDFDIRIIDGKEVSGFCYQNESTGWKEVFTEFTESQKRWAGEWVVKSNEIADEQAKAIKSWIS